MNREDDENESADFHCDLCNKTFRRHFNLKEHYKTLSHRANENETVVKTNYLKILKEINEKMKVLDTEVKQLNELIRKDIEKRTDKIYTLDEIKNVLNKQYISMSDGDEKPVKAEFKKQIKKIQTLKEKEKETGKLIRMTLKQFLTL